ncbi:cobyrinate a,c-diamide synthase [Rhodobium gokarnense]|uniref:Cobyrinic acid a,c-diamide synthase n=1 Tax=Rhodobium gokarnense TaxID=364296 RepID=A0ABT3H7C4_9HYPH|nr:cobyrinate a,c-diamide synthase [Rhodobium gokarnense]MCW2306294.1 cobyrinic acid a,c-diamide synthase [Rhodobium gokarnense]
MAHIYLSAAHMSSGKTVVSVGLSAALGRRGRTVQPFKKGPDYIDPMWLSRAAGRPCYNLDFNTMDADEIRGLFAAGMDGADIGLIEGNKGLYDGLDVTGGDCNAALAKLTESPVVLVLNVEGITRGAAPLVLGYQQFDPDVRIAGVILNSVVSARQEEKVRAVLEHYTDVPVIGAIGRDPSLGVPERHLGLTTPGDTDHRDRQVARLADAIAAGVDLDTLIAIAETAPALEPLASVPAMPRPDLTVAIARDAAFGFYYQDDLEAFAAAGAKPVFFDTMHDTALPQCDGLFIGGGFPETHMAELEDNHRLRCRIARAIANGLPTYAECGGLMYLCRTLTWHGARHTMVGAVAADAVMHERPQGRGLVCLEPTGAAPWPLAEDGMPIHAHEFHYAGLENVARDTVFACRVARGHGIDGTNDGIVRGNLVAGFSHLRSTAANRWVERFVAFMRAQKAQREAAAPVAEEIVS